jgi:hypothetical protein
VYSEAEAREFLRQYPASVGRGPVPEPTGARRRRRGLVAVGLLVTVTLVAALVVWLASR